MQDKHGSWSVSKYKPNRKSEEGAEALSFEASARKMIEGLFL